MPDVDTAPLIDAAREARRAGVGRRQANQEVAAHRLRARGFSYRRIAETLRIRYDVVSRWLYGEPPAPPATPLAPASQPAAPVPRPSPAVAPAAVPAQAASLEARIAWLESALVRFQDEALRREERLLAELAALRAALDGVVAPAASEGERTPYRLRTRERA